MAIDISRAYQWAIQTCNAPDVGYSQDYRNQETVSGVTYYDCSSFIWYALKAGGAHLSGWPFTTDTMRKKLIELGFKQVDAKGQILPGDIGWKTGHTEMCYQEGMGSAIFMGAHTGNATLANQVSIGDSSGDATAKRSFTEIYRYGDGGATVYGPSIYVVAAIAGNWWSESNINPGLYEGRKVVDLTDDSVYGGYGLGQWTNNPASGVTRRTKLVEWLRANGYSDDSPYGEWQYLLTEDYWTPVEAYPYQTLDSFIKSTSTDLQELTDAFCRCWEGITPTTARVEQANQVLGFLRLHAQSAAITDWVVSNDYLSLPQIMNNAVMLFRMVSGGGGGGGYPGKIKKGMPLWMKLRYAWMNIR